MKLADLFTTPPDRDIDADIGRDPMGLQVIWSYFGEKIFGNRISSISNDIRMYTFNLFNHYVIRDLTLNRKIRLSPKQEKEYLSNDSSELKAGLIIFLRTFLFFLEYLEILEISRWLEF